MSWELLTTYMYFTWPEFLTFPILRCRWTPTSNSFGSPIQLVFLGHGVKQALWTARPNEPFCG